MTGAYVQVGSGEHHVLALHGWFGSALGWGHLPEYLDTAKFTYVFMDVRGYGSRRGEPGSYTMAEAADDAIDLAGDLGWDRFSLLGHSMSGVAVQHVLARAPERVRRLVGVAPVPASGLPLGEAEWALFSGAADSPEKRAAIVNFATGNRLPAAFVAAIVRHSLEHSDKAAFGGYLATWARADIVAQVKGAEVPVKVITGEHDPSQPPEFMEQTWLQVYPNSELEVLRGAGHYPMHETPVALAVSIEEFLGRGLQHFYPERSPMTHLRQINPLIIRAIPADSRITAAPRLRPPPAPRPLVRCHSGRAAAAAGHRLTGADAGCTLFPRDGI
jgi:pimeloyl-ACP methyl ester carboxylesterase